MIQEAGLVNAVLSLGLTHCDQVDRPYGRGWVGGGGGHILGSHMGGANRPLHRMYKGFLCVSYWERRLIRGEGVGWGWVRK